MYHKTGLAQNVIQVVIRILTLSLAWHRVNGNVNLCQGIIPSYSNYNYDNDDPTNGRLCYNLECNSNEFSVEVTADADTGDIFLSIDLG